MLLITDRLYLKSPHVSMADKVLRYVMKNTVHFAPYGPVREKDFYTPEGQTGILNQQYEDFQGGRSIRLYIFLKENEELVIGDIGFTNIIFGGFKSCHLGYKLDEDHQGLGYMPEALTAGIRYVFEEVGLHRIEAHVMPGNERSISVLRKLRFQEEGYARKYLYLNGQWRDHIRFALINDKAEN